VGGFGKKYKTAVLMVQNHGSTGTDLNKKKYKYAAACPQITLKSWEPGAGVLGPGQSTPLTLKYDVEGCWTSMDYPLKFKAHIRGPGKVRDGVTDLVELVRNGADKQKRLFFNAGTGSGFTPGTYKLGIQFIFGATKKLTSATKIMWLEVTLKAPENAAATAVTGEGTPASLTLGR
jgi:hypothetical protein